MRAFILDDDPARHAEFARRYSRYEIVQAWSADQAISLLLTEYPFDVVQLDHDLDGKQMASSDSTSGFAVAKAIVSMWGAKQHGRVIVHSYNRRGALRMLQEFVESGLPCEYRPFGMWKEGGFE